MTVVHPDAMDVLMMIARSGATAATKQPHFGVTVIQKGSWHPLMRGWWSSRGSSRLSCSSSEDDEIEMMTLMLP